MIRVVSILLALAACSPEPVIVGVDPSFTDATTPILFAASDKWNVVTRMDAQITYANRIGATWFVVLQDPPPKVDGYCVPRGRYIQIRPGISDFRLYRTVLHEYGHMIGLHHVARGVMSIGNDDTEFSDEDMRECRHVGACP